MSFRKLPANYKSNTSNIIYPFTVKIIREQNQSKVKVTPGTVNGLVPTNIFDKFDISITGNRVYYVKIRALSNGSNITSCSIVVDTNLPTTQIPTPFAVPATLDILLAMIRGGIIYRMIGVGSLDVSGTQQYITERPNAGPGELTYIPYYKFVVSTI